MRDPGFAGQRWKKKDGVSVMKLARSSAVYTLVVVSLPKKLNRPLLIALERN